jgi:hypothetical protein
LKWNKVKTKKTCLRLRNEMKKRNAHHGPPIDAYIVPDTDEHQVIINLLKINK